MKIIIVTNVTKQNDWRFYDVEGEVYEVDNPDDFDCSICAIRGKLPKEKVKMGITFKQLKDIINNIFPEIGEPS